jgi:hypothetical protein
MATGATERLKLYIKFSALAELLGLRDDVRIVAVKGDPMEREACAILVEYPGEQLYNSERDLVASYWFSYPLPNSPLVRELFCDEPS